MKLGFGLVFVEGGDKSEDNIHPAEIGPVWSVYTGYAWDRRIGRAIRRVCWWTLGGAMMPPCLLPLAGERGAIPGVRRREADAVGERYYPVETERVLGGTVGARSPFTSI